MFGRATDHLDFFYKGMRTLLFISLTPDFGLTIKSYLRQKAEIVSRVSTKLIGKRMVNSCFRQRIEQTTHVK